MSDHSKPDRVCRECRSSTAQDACAQCGRPIHSATGVPGGSTSTRDRYCDLVDIVHTADSLLHNRLQFWAAIQAAAFAFFAVLFKDFVDVGKVLTCTVGVALAFVWWSSGLNISQRIKWADDEIRRQFPDSVRAQWLAQEAPFRIPSWLVINWFMPGTVMIAWIVLLFFS